MSDSVPFENRAVADFRDHDGVAQREVSNVVTVVRPLRTLRAEPAVMQRLDLLLGSTLAVPIALIGTGTVAGRYAVSLLGDEVVNAALFADPGCVGGEGEVSSALSEVAVEPEAPFCALLRVSAPAPDAVGSHRLQWVLTEVSPEGVALGVALVIELVVTVWGPDPVGGAMIAAEVLTNPVRYGGVLVVGVEVRNPSGERLVADLEYRQPGGTRTFAAQFQQPFEAADLRGLGSTPDGVATATGWKVPLLIAPNGSVRLRFFSRVQLGARSPLEAGLTLTSTREQGSLATVAAVAVEVAAPMEDQAFDRQRATLMGRAWFLDDGLASPVAGVRAILPDGRQVVSGANGVFAFPEVTRGWWRVQIDPHSLPPGAQLALSANDPFGRWMYVDGLAWLDLPLTYAGAEASATESAPGTNLREAVAWLTEPGEVILRDAPVPIRYRAPLSTELAVVLNGESLPAEFRGVVEIDLENGEQRVELAGIEFPVGVSLLELVTAEGRVPLRVRVPGEPAAIDVEVRQGIADGVQPIELQVVVRDRFGTPVGEGALRVAGGLALDPAIDARPETPGITIELRGGYALVRFLPHVGGGSYPLTFAFAEVAAPYNLMLTSASHNLWSYQGSLTFAVGERIRLAGVARAYLELAGRAGSLQLAIDAGASWQEAGLAFSPGFDAIPAPSYPVMGATTGPQRPLESDDGIAFRYQQGAFSLAYDRGPIGLEGIGIASFGSAARASVTSDAGHRIEVSAGLVAGDRVSLSIEPDGTRRYPLPYAVTPGSERVVLLTLGALGVLNEQTLRPDLDYVLQSNPPTLVLVEALWPTDPEGNERRLDLGFISPDAPRDTWVGGIGWTFTDRPWFAYASVARLPAASEAITAAAAGVRYAVPGLNLSAGVAQRGVEALRVRLAGDARWQHEGSGLELRASASWQGGDVWRALAAARIPVANLGSAEVNLERNDTDVHITTAVAARIAQVDTRTEVSYAIDEALWQARLSAAADLGRLRVGVAHVHPFAEGKNAMSSVRLDAPVTSALSVRLGLRHEWGQATNLEARVLQRWGISQWELSLTGGDAEPWNTQLSVRVPMQLWEGLRLDLAAGVNRSWVDGAAPSYSLSSTLSYRNDDLRASIGVDANYQGTWQKRIVTASLSGELPGSQTLRADLNVETEPTQRTRFSVGYALHRPTFNLLALQTVLHADGATELEGRADGNWRFRVDTSLRPRLAYRFSVADPESLTVQAGVGVTYHVNHTLGVGTVAYLGWQPRIGAIHLAGTVELSVALAEGLLLVGGYTFGDGPALLPGSADGIHLRLDVQGGAQ
jgi:hypothetical protein